MAEISIEIVVNQTAGFWFLVSGFKFSFLFLRDTCPNSSSPEPSGFGIELDERLRYGNGLLLQAKRVIS